MLERDKIVKASFFAKNPKQLEFLIKGLARIVGKENINFLVPKFQHKSNLYILNMDIKIPDTLLKNFFSYQPASNSKEESQ